MLNTDDFTKRLTILFDNYGLNASLFADKIGVQRSSISHILSGRNKPSLDFVIKILTVFPEVDASWILSGKGNFLKTELTVVPKKVADSAPIQPLLLEEKPADKLAAVEAKKHENSVENLAQKTVDSDISKIVIFYKNGTFEHFENLN